MLLAGPSPCTRPLAGDAIGEELADKEPVEETGRGRRCTAATTTAALGCHREGGRHRYMVVVMVICMCDESSGSRGRMRGNQELETFRDAQGNVPSTMHLYALESSPVWILGAWLCEKLYLSMYVYIHTRMQTYRAHINKTAILTRLIGKNGVRSS